jgi:hypothetical protein
MYIYCSSPPYTDSLHGIISTLTLQAEMKTTKSQYLGPVVAAALRIYSRDELEHISMQTKYDGTYQTIAAAFRCHDSGLWFYLIARLGHPQRPIHHIDYLHSEYDHSKSITQGSFISQLQPGER